MYETDGEDRVMTFAVRRIFYAAVTLASFAAAMPVNVPAYANDLRQEMRLVTGDAFPPFADRAYDGGGIVTEVVRRSFDAMGYQNVSVIWRSWLKGFEMTVEGRVDGTFPYAQTPSRKKLVLFSEPITNLSAYGWFAKKHEKYDDNIDLLGKSLCLPLGHGELGHTGKLLASGQAKRVSPPDMKTCFKLLAAGRVDSVVSPVPEALNAMSEAGLSPDDFDHIGQSLSNMPLYFVVGVNHPSAQIIIKDFNAGLAVLRANGELEKILSQARY